MKKCEGAERKSEGFAGLKKKLSDICDRCAGTPQQGNDVTINVLNKNICCGAQMIKFKFPKRRDVRAFEEIYPRQTAQQKADEAKDGVIGGLARVFSNKRSAWVLSDYFLRYEPIWHIVGESFFEYIRRNQYHVEVKPEVRSVTINKVVVRVAPDKPVCTFEGDEHCFEKYTQETSVRAWGKSKEKDALKPYAAAKARQIKSVSSLMRKDTDIVPVETRASFLISEMLKSLLKPIQADKIIKEVIAIKKLTLYLLPVHVFNYTNSESGKTKTICVDAVTGEVHKPNTLVERLKGVHPTEDTFFDIGGGLVDSIVPGLGLGVFVGKKIKDYRKRKKIKRQMEASKAAAGE